MSLKQTLLMCTLLGGTSVVGNGCSTKMLRNSVYTADTGHVVIKGFGSKFGAHVTCVLTPGPYGVKETTGTEGNIDISTWVEAGLKRETAREVALLHAQTERLVALDTVLGQMCVAYGNGAFGPVDCASRNDEARCAPTRAVYLKHVHDLLDKFAQDPVVILEPTGQAPSADADPSAPETPAETTTTTTMTTTTAATEVPQ